MNLLFRVIYAAHCRSTHHKLALDALRHLPDAADNPWSRLFLKHHNVYLRGAKDPDTTFKDFRNHVLHVSDNHWGGAVQAANQWRDATLAALQKQDWAAAVYSAGVLSHYYTDPIQPLHTAQSEAENNIHRAAEWSICKSYDPLWKLAQQQGFPQVDVSSESDWLADMVTRGAEFSHPFYHELVERYDFDRGVKDPPAGLDDPSRQILAKLLAYASVGWARILERLFAEADVQPPAVHLTLDTLVASLQMPIRWVTRKLADAGERRQIEAMHQELQATGKVEQTLSEDDRTIRELHAEEVAQRAAQLKPTKKPKPAKPKLRFYLELNDDVEQAPSIGPKTAKRLEAIHVHTVADLLAIEDPAAAAAELDVRHITAEVLADWQDQARLVSRIPRLRGHDAQILVACDFRAPQTIAEQSPEDLLQVVTPFAESSEGKRILRSSKKPDLQEVSDWIAWAHEARAA